MAKKKLRNKKGFIEFILVVMVVLGLLLTGGLRAILYNNTPPPSDNAQYIIITPTVHPQKQTLQFQGLNYTVITPTPTLTPTPTSPAGPYPFPSGPGGDPNSTCRGTYNLNYPIVHVNFGDPQCNFTKNDLYRLLQQIDPANASFWFSTVIPCESSYNPNAIQPPWQSVDPGGAWGLYQMGRGRNGQYDHGDVPWEYQSNNAVQYNKRLLSIGLEWHYWACARSRWQ